MAYSCAFLIFMLNIGNQHCSFQRLD